MIFPNLCLWSTVTVNSSREELTNSELVTHDEFTGSRLSNSTPQAV